MTESNAISPALSGQASGVTASAGSAGNPKAGAASSTPAKLTGPALWMAIFAVVVWIGFSVLLIVRAGTNDTEWSRIAWVFGSIQAIAFAAAGALFGTAVQQQNVSNAQQQAATAKQDADQQRDAATKGRALAATMQAEGAAQAGTPTDDRKPTGPDGAPAADPATVLAKRHADLSRAPFGNIVPPDSSRPT